MKILYVIMHGIHHTYRYNNVINTWGKDVDYIFYSDYVNDDKNMIKVSNNTDYNGLEEKIINTIKIINNDYIHYDWYLFCDDDTFVNVNLLNKEIENFDEKYVYGKILVDAWSQDYSLIFCSGGGGTLIHKNNLIKLGSNLKYNNIGVADVSLGMNLRDSQIKIINSELFCCGSPDEQNINESEYKNYITFHNIRTEENMKKIYEKI